MKIVKRAEAKAKNMLRYYTGARCRNGHISPRLVSNGACIECQLKYRIKLKTPEQREKARINQRAYLNSRTAEQKIELSRARRTYKYGITSEMLKSLWHWQGGRCACCGLLFENEKEAYVDHCHDTNQVRGLLCRMCNISEGSVKKTGLIPAEWGRRMQQYLEKPPFAALNEIV